MTALREHPRFGVILGKRGAQWQEVPNLPLARSEVRCEALQRNVVEREFRCVAGKCVDVNKGDLKKPVVRSRYVTKHGSGEDQALRSGRGGKFGYGSGHRELHVSEEEGAVAAPQEGGCHREGDSADETHPAG